MSEPLTFERDGADLLAEVRTVEMRFKDGGVYCVPDSQRDMTSADLSALFARNPELLRELGLVRRVDLQRILTLANSINVKAEELMALAEGGE